MATAGVAPVEAHGVDAVQPLHPARELGLRRLDEEVEVVVEQVPRVHLPAETPFDVEEEVEPRGTVEIVEHDRPLLDATGDDVVPGRARQAASWDPWHGLDASGASVRAKPSLRANVQGQSLGHVLRIRTVVQTAA